MGSGIGLEVIIIKTTKLAKKLRNFSNFATENAKEENMASTKFYLDTRRVKKDGTYPLRIDIGKDSMTCSIRLNVSLRPEEWDPRKKMVINRPDEDDLNMYISSYKYDIDRILRQLIRLGKTRTCTVLELKKMIEDELYQGNKEKKSNTRDFSSIFREFIDLHHGSARESYKSTYTHLQGFVGYKIEKLRFEDISKKWLEAFDRYLVKRNYSMNVRDIHFRNIYAVFDYALDNGITTNYPFRAFKIMDVNP